MMSVLPPKDAVNRHAQLVDRSVLLICACDTARMCRLSTQITGKPASARARKSPCDNGSASRPIRLKAPSAILARNNKTWMGCSGSNNRAGDFDCLVQAQHDLEAGMSDGSTLGIVGIDVHHAATALA
jgi:hypothetical protein